MNRPSEILIGIILFILAFVLVLVSVTSVTTNVPSLIVASIAGVLGFACLFTSGRPLTTRVALGLLSGGMVGLVCYCVVIPKPDFKAAAFAGAIAIMTGGYAISGFYPRNFYLSEVFGKSNPENHEEKSLDKASSFEPKGSEGEVGEKSSLGNFDLGRFTLLGWIWFLVSVGVGITAAIIAGNLIEGGPGANQQDSGRRRATIPGIIGFGGALGVFFLGRFLLGLIGITLVRPKKKVRTKSSDMDQET